MEEPKLISLKVEAARQGITEKVLREKARAGQVAGAIKKNNKWWFQEGIVSADNIPDEEIDKTADINELQRVLKYHAAKKMKAEANIKKAEEYRLTGRLVDAKSLTDEWESVLVSIKQQLLCIPDTIRREIGPEVINDFRYKTIQNIVDSALLAASKK